MGEYDEALKKSWIKGYSIFKAKKIQILFRKEQFEEIKKEISDSEKKGNIKTRLMIDQIAAQFEIKNGEYKKARLKTVYETLQKAYPKDFEYIGREVIDSLAECENRGGLSTTL